MTRAKHATLAARQGNTNVLSGVNGMDAPRVVNDCLLLGMRCVVLARHTLIHSTSRVKVMTGLFSALNIPPLKLT